MPTSNRLLDQLDRNERHKTRERRENRARRRNFLLGFLLLFGLLLVLGLPSLISQSGYSRSLLAKAARDYGFDVDAETVRIGWLTPLRLSGLTAQGAAGTRIDLEHLDAEITVLDVLRGQTRDLGVIDVRGLHLTCEMNQGRCSLEDDLAVLLSPDDSSDGANESGSDDGASDAAIESAIIRLQDVTVDMIQPDAGRTWTLTQGSAEAVYESEGLEASLVGVLREPTGEEGSIQGRVSTTSAVATAATETPPSDPRQMLWKADVRCETLPLSIVSLGETRWGDSLPADIRGDLSGQIAASGFASGAIDVALRGVEVRNFAATEPAAYSTDSKQASVVEVESRPVRRLWHNELATLDGDIVFNRESISGRQLRFQSDFSSGRFDGTIANSFTLLGSNDNLLRWLDRIDGVAEANVDLAQFHRALPGLLPTRAGAEIVGGRIHGRLESLGGQRVVRSQLVLQTDRIQARSSGRDVSIEPVRLTAIVADHEGALMAEKFQLDSDFAVATGQGDLQQGQADVEVDFSQLASSLRPIIDLSDIQLRGRVVGQIQWNVERSNRWHLVGQGRGRNLRVSLPGGQTIERQVLDAHGEAIGVWDGAALQEMSVAEMHLASDGVKFNAELTDPVSAPDGDAIYPIRIHGSGPLGTLRDITAAWLPESIQGASGSFQLTGQGDITASACRLTSVVLDLRQPRWIAPLHSYQQQSLALRYGGDLRFPDGIAKVDDLLIKGDSFTVNASGFYSPRRVDLNATWKADLERLSDVQTPRIAKRSGVQPVAFDSRNTSTDGEWLLSGTCEGQVRIMDLADADAGASSVIQAGEPSAIQNVSIRGTFRGNDLFLRQRTDANGFNGGSPVGRTATPSIQTVWSEPTIQLVTDSTLDLNSGRLDSRSTELVTQWLATDLAGYAVWNDEQHDVRLRGPTSMKMNEVARLLSRLTGTSIRAVGEHQSPVQIRVGMAKAGGVAFDISGHMGWEQAEMGGVLLGESNIPFHVTETKVILDRTKIPVGGGHVDPAGQIHYGPGPLQIQLEPGRLAERVRVSPEMADKWLKYLAPVMADVARIDGTIGCDIQEGFLVLDDSSQSRVTGRLNIDEVEMSSGPMTSSIIGGVDQLRGLAGFANGRNIRDRSNTRLIRLPPQQVDFQLNRGQVVHRRLVMQIDRAEVFTGGSVSLDGALNMVAQVPLDERWLGSDLKSLAGQSIRFPIQGTIWQPRLDNREMQRVVAGLGAQAVQGAVDGYLDKGRQKINEELLRGLDKLNLGPLFGQ